MKREMVESVNHRNTNLMSKHQYQVDRDRKMKKKVPFKSRRREEAEPVIDEEEVEQQPELLLLLLRVNEGMLLKVSHRSFLQ